MPGFEKFGDEERRELQDVLDNGVLMRYGFDPMRNGHWKVQEFEAALCERLDAPYAHCVSSGTAAVWSALVCAGVGDGHEVIVPPFTFVASMEAILFAGAVPVFGEIDETLGLDPSRLAEVITPKTKAVMLVHMCGAMAQVDQIKEICDHHGLELIEDVAQAMGGSLNGTPLGRFGRFGCFSFDPVKTITSAEGGAIITHTEADYRLVDAFTDHGHDHLGADRGQDRHPIMGLNFRLSELHAAVGIAQLRKLDGFLEHQRAIRDILETTLAPLDHVSFRKLPDRAGDTATFFSFFLQDADMTQAAVTGLTDGGVDGCFYWYANNWHYYKSWDHFRDLKTPHPIPLQRLDQPMRYQNPSLPQSDDVMSRCISMLIKLSWSLEEAQERAEKMKVILSSLG